MGYKKNNKIYDYKKGLLFTYILWDKEVNIFSFIFFISGGIVGFSQNTNALKK